MDKTPKIGFFSPSFHFLKISVCVYVGGRGGYKYRFMHTDTVHMEKSEIGLRYWSLISTVFETVFLVHHCVYGAS